MGIRLSSSRRQAYQQTQARRARPRSPYTKVYATAITAGSFVYRFAISETSAAALPAGVKYSVDVYASYNADATYQLLATAYVGQSTAVDTAVEGVEVWVDLGTGAPDYTQ
jgi:hypothetical protein